MAMSSSSSSPSTSTSSATTASDSPSPKKVPSLIVFDLDNTLWTPELYQLRKLQRQGPDAVPVAGRDVKLFPGARAVLESIRSSRGAAGGGGEDSRWAGASFAVASRTKSVVWARDLLEQFDLTDLFDHVEIFPGDKVRHFQNLRESSGVPYERMLFFDDNRDGRFGNCVPVSGLGVLSVHCPGGIVTEDVFHTGLDRYASWGGEPNTVVEWDGSVSVLREQAEGAQERFEGVVKKVLSDKRFGFVRYGDRNTQDLFFHFNSLPNRGRGESAVGEGDRIEFSVAADPKNGKKMATKINKKASSDAPVPGDNAEADMVNMRVFSMNLPFAALLANEYKTLETRNGTMFVPYPEGTKMLLHVGKRTYPDGDRHLDVMRSGGLTDDEISNLKSLPEGFGRGMAVAVVELGRTYETTLEERCDPDFQRGVGAFGADSGMRVTEIRRVEYLKRPVRVSGSGGVFKADVDRNVIPDGWLD